MDLLFVNGPVHNGPFTFKDSPGKAVGLLIAEALNSLLGNPTVRHLWNCATLANDLRHRSLNPLLPREEFEADQIRRKYHGSAWQYHEVEIATDADAEVCALALDIITDRLSAKAMEITYQTVHTCIRCGHMGGLIPPSECAVCGSERFRSERQRHLVVRRPINRPVLEQADLYGTTSARHLRAIASNYPERLLLSRTRNYGISLDEIGLPGSVLDARAAVHIAALAETRRLRGTEIVMTATPKAIANIAAHGLLFREHEGIRLRYGPHGRVPAPAVHLTDVDPADHQRILFRRWFLPLTVLGRTTDLSSSQIPAIFTYFRKAWLLREQKTAGYTLRNVRKAIRTGDHQWIMRKHVLASLLRTLAPPTTCVRAHSSNIGKARDPLSG